MADNDDPMRSTEELLKTLELTDIQVLSLNVAPAQEESEEETSNDGATPVTGEFTFTLTGMQTRDKSIQVTAEAILETSKVKASIKMGAAFQSRITGQIFDLDEQASLASMGEMAFPAMYPHIRAMFPPLLALAGQSLPILPVLQVGDLDRSDQTGPSSSSEGGKYT